MTMKRISIFLALVLILSTICGTTLSFAGDEESKYLDDKTYHHLDFCVYCTVQNSNGKWDNDKAYGSFADLSLPITFGNQIEIQNAYFYTGAESDAFTFNSSNGDSWNVKVAKWTEYDNAFSDWVCCEKPSSINAVIGSKGNDVTLSYRAKIQSNQKLNVKNGYDNRKDSPQKIKDYKNKVYKAWGGEKGLAAQASVDEGAKAIYDGLAKVFSGSSSIKELDLVFIPIVIEYKILKPEGVTCERCGKCLVHGDTVCTEESCENYGTEECGCYTPPVITSDFTSSGTCVVSKTWTTHNHSHSYNCHTVGEGESAKRVCSTCYYSVTHTVKLELSNVKLTADKPMKSHKGNEVTFKSGYGFYVTGNAKTTYTHTSTCSHGRNPSDGSYTQPTKAYLSTNWTVKGSDKKKKFTQGKTVELAINGGSITTKENPISNYGKKLIYTDVELKGTKKNPVKHTVTLYVKGATVTVDGKTQELCASVPLTFWIKGNMYEDDYTVETR